MATYKQPKSVPAVVVGEGGGKNTLKKNVASAGDIRTGDYAGVKTDGIKIRGTGAATKGTLARGPMG